MRGGRLWVVLAASMALLWLACPPRAGAHGGQRIVPILVELEPAERSVVVTYSFDVGLLLEGISVDREWLAAQTVADLEAMSADAEAQLATWYAFSVGGLAVEGAYAFPDLEKMADPEFDNGEPSGHVLVRLEGAYGEGGGAFLLESSDEAPGTVVTTVVGGKTKRRPDVVLANEARKIVDLEGVADGGGPVAGGQDVVELEGGPVAEPDPALMAELAAAEAEFGDPGDAGAVVSWRAMARDGFGHVWDWRGGHWFLAAVLFLGCRGGRELWAQFGGLATGSVVAVLVRMGFDGSWPQVAFLGLVAALGADAACAGEAEEGRGRPWRVVLAMVVGYVHSAGMMGGFEQWLREPGVMLPLALGVVAGDGVLVFLAFVVFGWGWGVKPFRKWVARPAAGLAGAAAIFCFVA